MLREPLKDRARGRWPGILSAIGVPPKALRNRHGPCPVCGGKDRFRFDDKGGTGSFYCSQCGPGDGIELVKRLRHVDFRDAATLIEEHLGEAPISRSGQHRPRADGRKREEMIALWSRSRPIELNDHAGQYLHDRTGLTTFPSCMRFSPDERYTQAGSKPSWHPALVAKVDPSDAGVALGERAAIHRTYLSAFATKADVAAPRKMLGAMPTGAAVRLMQHEDLLGIAEGIETALCDRTIMSRWAIALSLWSTVLPRL